MGAGFWGRRRPASWFIACWWEGQGQRTQGNDDDERNSEEAKSAHHIKRSNEIGRYIGREEGRKSEAQYSEAYSKPSLVRKPSS